MPSLTRYVRHGEGALKILLRPTGLLRLLDARGVCLGSGRLAGYRFKTVIRYRISAQFPRKIPAEV